MEMKELSLRDIAHSFAQRNANYSQFHGKLYSFVPPEPDKALTFMNEISLTADAFPGNVPATMIVGKLASLVPYRANPILVQEEGQLKLQFQIENLRLPDCDYLAIVAPVSRNDGETNYFSSFQAISFLRSLIALSLGKLPFYAWIADFDFDIEGVVSLTSEAVRVPLYGDFFKIFDASLVNEILGRLVRQQLPYRIRFQRACDFFDMALSQRNEAFRFSSYWIALEIIVGGKNDAIRTSLSKAYGNSNKKFADDYLLFGEISGMRNSLIHHGEFGVLKSYQERLLQLYFWDIVRHQVGLNCRQLARELVLSGLVDQEKQHK
ncbi:HEPN domain-containing protein [Rhodopseudomonas sp. BR0M22]|uniref:HEPN domain-containing protein n=1 Tax=Rhodopseudomonas sp. BR0M22 TaxID=2269369 RepID=UPI0013DE9312